MQRSALIVVKMSIPWSPSTFYIFWGACIFLFSDFAKFLPEKSTFDAFVYKTLIFIEIKVLFAVYVKSYMTHFYLCLFFKDSIVKIRKKLF